MKEKEKKKKISIHIADDHKMLIDGMKAVLNTEESFEVVGTSLNGAHVIKWFDEHEADILILDIEMPELDGIEVLRSLKTKAKKPKTIVLTSYNDNKLIREVLQMDVKGFVTKVNAGANIIEAIKAVSADEMYFSSDIKNKIVSSFAGKKADNDYFKEYFGMLTEREYEVLKLIGEEHENKEIANRLYISSATVETHKRNIMQKLGVKSMVGLGMYITKHKLIEDS